MSRVGKLPIPVPQGVKVEINGSVVSVEGPKGKLVQAFHPDMKIRQHNGTLFVERPSDHRTHKALHGLTRSLLANMVEGVTKGFEVVLEVRGMGYRVDLRGNRLFLNLGFSHPVEVDPEPGVSFDVQTFTPTSQNGYLCARITVRGISKQQVGQVAAKIRAIRKVEPYKGKGIRYVDEVVRLKAGKQAKAGERK